MSKKLIQYIISIKKLKLLILFKKNDFKNNVSLIDKIGIKQ